MTTTAGALFRSAVTRDAAAAFAMATLIIAAICL
jgi:hypothetical protein